MSDMFGHMYLPLASYGVRSYADFLPDIVIVITCFVQTKFSRRMFPFDNFSSKYNKEGISGKNSCRIHLSGSCVKVSMHH